MKVDECKYEAEVDAKMRGIDQNIVELKRLNGYMNRLNPMFRQEKVYYFDHQ